MNEGELTYEGIKKSMEHFLHGRGGADGAVCRVSDGLPPVGVQLLHRHFRQYGAHLQRWRPAVR